MERLAQEIGYAARTLVRTPVFAAVVVLTLALAIGANTAIFSVVNAILLRPLAFPEPERLAVVWETMPRGEDAYMFTSPPNFADWKERTTAFEELAAFSPREFFLTGHDETSRVWGAKVSAALFEVLRVRPVIGRLFTPDDDRPGAERVAMLGDALWRSRFGSASDVVGRPIRLDDGVYTIVGVMPEDFDFPPPIDLEGKTLPHRNDLWVPLAMDIAKANRSAHNLRVIGRLRSGVNLTTASANMQEIAADLGQQYPKTNAGWGVRVVPFGRVVLGDVQPALLLLLGAVGLVLLIACVNIANLMLARSTDRQREYAIRAALGAGRSRLVRQSITESLVLASAGGAAGLLLAYVGLEGLLRLVPGNVPRLAETRIDLTAIGFTLAITLITGLLFGLAPALRSLSGDVNHQLKDGTRSTGEPGHRRLSAGLVVVEVALSLVLLVAAGLLFNSFLALHRIDPGFRTDDVVMMRLTLPRSYGESRSRLAVYREIEERVAVLPGVVAAGLTRDVPLAGDHQGTVMVIEGDPQPAPGENEVRFTAVTSGYFRSLGVPLLAGRLFDGRDEEGGVPVVIINETAAALYFRGRDAVGRRIVFDQPRTIVGVVGGLRLEDLKADRPPAMYLSYDQLGEYRNMSLVVRAHTDPAAMLASVRHVIGDVDRSIAVYDLRTMKQLLWETLAEPRFSSLMLVVFSVVALALAAVGIYGVISYSVGQRSREIGVRLALGARPADVLHQVIGEGMRLVAAGLAFGLLASLGFARFVRSLLYGVTPMDPATIAGASFVLLVVAFVACYLPARRSSRVDPVLALRAE